MRCMEHQQDSMSGKWESQKNTQKNAMHISTGCIQKGQRLHN